MPIHEAVTGSGGERNGFSAIVESEATATAIAAAADPQRNVSDEFIAAILHCSTSGETVSNSPRAPSAPSRE